MHTPTKSNRQPFSLGLTDEERAQLNTWAIEESVRIGRPISVNEVARQRLFGAISEPQKAAA